MICKLKQRKSFLSLDYLGLYLFDGVQYARFIAGLLLESRRKVLELIDGLVMVQ